MIWKPVLIGLIISAFILFYLNSSMNSALAAETNTVSSTVVTDKSVPTASAPSVVVNNSDICKTATSGAVQTQIFGIASGITIRDENCELLKLSRSLYAMGMKVAAVSLLSTDYRVFDSMLMAGTPPPINGLIGSEALKEWKLNPELIPEGSKYFNKIELTKTQEQKDNDMELAKFLISAMALYIGFPFFF